MTATGAKADHRLTTAPDPVPAFAPALAARLGAPIEPPAMPPDTHRFVDAAAADLVGHQGEALVLTGEWQPPAVHALAHWINQRIGAPVDHVEPIGASEPPASGGAAHRRPAAHRR
jgi:hypothetical protein